MKKMILIIATWIASSIAIVSPAYAQLVPSSSYSTESGHQQHAATPPILGRSPEDRIMVMGDAEDIASRRSPPRAAREHQVSDVNTEYTYAEWMELSRRNGWSDPAQTFQARRQSNYQMCRETTLFILLWSDLEERFIALRPALGELFPRVLGLRRNIIQAAQISGAASLLSTALGGILSGGTYAAVLAPGAVGHIAQTSAHANQALDNRDATLVTLGFTELSLEAHILSARGNVRYYEMMEDYCTEFLSSPRI